MSTSIKSVVQKTLQLIFFLHNYNRMSQNNYHSYVGTEQEVEHEMEKGT